MVCLLVNSTRTSNLVLKRLKVKGQGKKQEPSYRWGLSEVAAGHACWRVLVLLVSLLTSIVGRSTQSRTHTDTRIMRVYPRVSVSKGQSDEAVGHVRRGAAREQNRTCLWEAFDLPFSMSLLFILNIHSWENAWLRVLIIIEFVLCHHHLSIGVCKIIICNIQ